MEKHNILWMDDQLQQIVPLIKALRIGEIDFDADIAPTIEKARELLKTKNYTALIVDCEMNSSNEGHEENGANFLKEVNQSKRWMPSFAYTSFKSDVRFSDLLKESDAIIVCEKTEHFGTPVWEDIFFQTIFKYSDKARQVIHHSPEKIQFLDYLENPILYKESFESHWDRNSHWITKEMKNNDYCWAIVIGNRIEKGGSDIKDFPSEEDLIKYGRKKNLIPFAYSLIPSPESIDEISNGNFAANWNSTSRYGDLYPSLTIEIENKLLCEDFDTGAMLTHVSDKLIIPGFLDSLQGGSHLNQDYQYLTKKIKIKLVDNWGNRKEIPLVVKVIRGWEKSPFVHINPKRKILIGRDILSAANIRIELNSYEKLSRTFFLPDHESKELYQEINYYNNGNIKVSDLHTIYYEEYGNPSGKPVVVLHGGPGAGMSRKTHRFFNPEKYRIVLFDQRGCGKSTPHACIDENSTQHLVNDIEKLRDALKIDKWQVFGGSWGSTLALAYAQTYPNSISELILRGIFMLRSEELCWFYQKGVDMIFPEEWENYVAPIETNKRSNLINAYHELLNCDDTDRQIEAAKAWSIWESRLSTLYHNKELEKRANDDTFSLAFARIENHYFKNNGFFSSETELLDGIDKIRHIPTYIVQGRYDMVCPMKTAWELAKKFPEAIFLEARSSGHSAFEPEIASKLVGITNYFSNKI